MSLIPGDTGTPTSFPDGFQVAGNGSPATPAFTFLSPSNNTGMYSPGDDQIAFSSNGVRSLLVGASGNFTLGTESGSVQVSHTIFGYSSAFTWGNGTLNISNRNGSNAVTIVMANNVTKFASWSSSNTFPWAVQDSSGNDLGYMSSSGAVTLGPSTGANHTAYGTLKIGPSSSNGSPTPSGLTTFNDSSSSVHWRMFRVSATTIDHYISGVEYHIINASGGVKLTVGATSWASISDERQKKNISPLNYGLEKVMQINPIRFDYNSDVSENGKRIGFSAQNLRPIIPEAVSEDVEMDVLSVASTELVPVLVKAIQEQQAIIDELKARIEALEGE